MLNRTLPAPAEWAYHLDLWQNPFAVARYYQVPLWSKEHFDAMRAHHGATGCSRTEDHHRQHHAQTLGRTNARLLRDHGKLDEEGRRNMGFRLHRLRPMDIVV